MKGTIAAIAVLMLSVVAACDKDDSSTTTMDVTSSTVPPSETTAATSTPTTAPPTSTTPPTSSETSTTPTPTPTPTSTSNTTTSVPPECDADDAIAIADAIVELARLDVGGAWQTRADSAAFDDRTNDAAEFGARLAFRCAERLVQLTPDGDERLALVAWNDLRHAVVLQATDPPAEPYRTDAVFQLFIEQPYGEFLVDQFVWAATMAGGESIVIATHDYSAAITAKSWQSAVPPFDDLPVTLDSEQFAIDALTAVGARNVSLAEPTTVGSPISTIQFNTPLALQAFAVIGPADSFDPTVPIVPDGESTFSEVEGVEIRLTVGKELGQFDLYETGWSCGDHAWRLYAGLGTPAELLDFTDVLVRSPACT